MTKVLGVAVLIAMIAVSALAGRSYRWCIPAERVAASTCCAPEVTDALDAPVTDAVRSSCCEDRAFGHLPATDPRAQVPVVPPMPLAPTSTAAIPLPVPLAVAVAALDRPTSSEAARARAGPLTSAERCNVLQVFRC